MKYICDTCGHIYDEEKGEPGYGIPAGTLFAELPVHYGCAVCGADKGGFVTSEKGAKLPKQDTSAFWNAAKYGDSKGDSQR